MCVVFSTAFLLKYFVVYVLYNLSSKTLLIIRDTGLDTIKHVYWFPLKVPVILVIF
jgi:hypothetical protein